MQVQLLSTAPKKRRAFGSSLFWCITSRRRSTAPLKKWGFILVRHKPKAKYRTIKKVGFYFGATQAEGEV
ncbi:MAG: hypothetical protein K2G44_03880, partial [Clostridia bacterium]|nr:hypothetical protein [Clostridia bacterium]